MSPRVLSRRELNRATLARQLLLGRTALTVPAAVEQLAGLQAQVPNPPYLGLWTRLQTFQRDDLTWLMEARQIVRAAMMRSTLHLLTARDFLQFRPVLQAALVKALNAFFGKDVRGLDVEPLLAAARPFFESAPRTFAEVRDLLSPLAPDRDPEALAYVVRSHLPLVQVFPGGVWGSGGSPAYAAGDSWLGEELPSDAEAGFRTLVLRYLAAFGPASVQDVQAWSGLSKLKEPLEALRGELRTFRDEAGVELLDLPDAPLPSADVPAPVAFIPEYDNLILSHADRTRLVADEYRSKIYLSAARVRATFLVDGFVRGTWKVERAKGKAGTAALIVEPFVPLERQTRADLEAEGNRLIRFIEDEAKTVEVRFAEVE